MSVKRPTPGKNSQGTPSKKSKTQAKSDYFVSTLQGSGLTLKRPPEKCVTNQETIHILRNIKKNLQQSFDYPRNVQIFYSEFENHCREWDVFKHYLFPNVVRITEDNPEEHALGESVIKILLGVPILQDKLIDFIFDRAEELAAESQCGPSIQMILKSFSSLDTIVDLDKMSTRIINLLDITSEKMVRLEIITAIPDIVGDQEHNNIAAEMSRILTEDQDLIPAILDCLTYLCLSDEQYEELQKKTLTILSSLSKYNYFPNFVKFLLMPGRTCDAANLEAVHGLRNALAWPTSIASPQDIASSQVLTASAIRNSIVSSKVTGNAWMKVVSSCKASIDHKAIDFIILVILYSTTEEKQRQVENIIRKQVKLNILKEDLLEESFEMFKPILKDHLKNIIELTNSLLKSKADPMVETFAAHIYELMFAKLDDCCQTIVAELLQLGLNCKQSVINMLMILNNVASTNMSVLKPHSLQMLTLLDRMDDMSLAEIRAVMNLVCGLAYSYENSVIRDDIHMIIRKELSSSRSTIKIQGILAGIHAVKYLMATDENEDQTLELPNDVSYSSGTLLSEGDLREAAQIIEMISWSTRQFPDMMAFFYDELSIVISSSTRINKNFLSWLTDAVTNDLQQNFIEDNIVIDRIGDLRLGIQYCVNAESEMDEAVAINIAGLALQPKEVVVGILSPLFQLVQTLHLKKEGNLSLIDVLLGCGVIMPRFNIDNIEDLNENAVRNILDCLVHCANWFRELLNGFAAQDDDVLKTKILQRVVQTEEIEKLISQILLTTNIAYKPPNFNVNSYLDQADKIPKSQSSKPKPQKKTNPDDTILPETVRSQATQNTNAANRSKCDGVSNIPLRSLNLNIINLVNNDLAADNDTEGELTIKQLKFILRCTNENLEKILISKIKRPSFFSKDDVKSVYDPKKAADSANIVSQIFPKIMEHLAMIITNIEKHTSENTQTDSDAMYTSETMDYLQTLEYIYNMFTTYFKWIGFKSHHSALLKSSLRTIGSSNKPNVVTLKDLLLNAAKYVKSQEKYCLQLSTAVSLVEWLKSIEEFSSSGAILKLLTEMAHNFLCQQWKTLDGLPEKGMAFNQSIDKLAGIYFTNNDISTIKSLTLQLAEAIKLLKSANDTLPSFKCINKSNFPILYRNLGTGLHEAAKSRLGKRLTNTEHLSLWKDVATILKSMSEIAKTLRTRNNLLAFSKKSVPVLKLFLSQGIPIIQKQFKSDTEEVLEILKSLQLSTRDLHSLCCHSRLLKDKALMSKVPHIKHLTEQLVYKVKATFAANNCTEAFWMGNLKNKNIDGEVIASQESEEGDEIAEDCDEQLPDDDSDDESDDGLNPESRSMSDVI